LLKTKLFLYQIDTCEWKWCKITIAMVERSYF
jgi:hypothetical protein